MFKYTFNGTFEVIAKNEVEARRILNKCFPSSREKLEASKIGYRITREDSKIFIPCSEESPVLHTTG